MTYDSTLQLIMHRVHYVMCFSDLPSFGVHQKEIRVFNYDYGINANAIKLGDINVKHKREFRR